MAVQSPISLAIVGQVIPRGVCLNSGPLIRTNSDELSNSAPLPTGSTRRFPLGENDG